MTFRTRGVGARWRQRRREAARGAERGVGVVEYALAITLVVVASLGAIQSLEDDAGEHLRDRGEVLGAPDLPDSGISTSTTSTSTTSTTVQSPTDAAASIVSQDAGGTADGKSWSPTVTVQVTNSSTSAPLANATITVRWTKTPGGAVVDQTFVTGSNGRGTFQLTGLEGRSSKNDYVASVLFEVVSITGTNPPITYTPGTPLTTTVSDPMPGNT